MKVLALDHGSKRIGVAVSDAQRIHAFPLEVVQGQDRHKVMTRISELVKENEVSVVVVGLPLTMLGERGPQAVKVEEFAERLRRKLEPNATVELWDERLSSAQADRGRVGAKGKPTRDGTRDMMAAVVILQSFLDRKP